MIKLTSKSLLKTGVCAFLSLNVAFTPILAQAQNTAAARSAGIDISSDTPVRPANTKPTANSLEDGIWVESDKVEQKARSSGERTRHLELETYVQSVMHRLLGDRSSEVRIYVMDRPFFNASAAPNGYIEVWTGLLLRVETEDELAFVVGHEAGHYLHSHSVQAYQSFKDRQHAAIAAGIIISIAAMGAAANAATPNAATDIMNAASTLTDVLYLGTLASFLSFSREKEGSADIYGYDLAQKANYYPRAGENIWKRIIDETAASDEEKKRRSPTRINVFSSHPLEVERIDALKTYDLEANNKVQNTISNENELKAKTEYRNHIRPYLAEWLRDDLRRRDYGQTIFIIDNLLKLNQDIGLLNYFKGEALRLRAKDTDLENAILAYRAAIAAPDAPIDTQKQIGEVYRRQGKNTEAINAYKTYISTQPNAEDVWIVEDLISQLEKNP